MKNCILYPVYVAFVIDGHEDPMGFGDTPEQAIQEHADWAEEYADEILTYNPNDLYTVKVIAVLPDHDRVYFKFDPLQYIRDHWGLVYFSDPIN